MLALVLRFQIDDLKVVARQFLDFGSADHSTARKSSLKEPRSVTSPSVSARAGFWRRVGAFVFDALLVVVGIELTGVWLARARFTGPSSADIGVTLCEAPSFNSGLSQSVS